jgi:hypothetical protein
MVGGDRAHSTGVESTIHTSSCHKSASRASVRTKRSISVFAALAAGCSRTRASRGTRLPGAGGRTAASGSRKRNRVPPADRERQQIGIRQSRRTAPSPRPRQRVIDPHVQCCHEGLQVCRHTRTNETLASCTRRLRTYSSRPFRSDHLIVAPGVPLIDAQWARIELLLSDRTPRRGGRLRDHREMTDAIAFKFQTGSQWVHLAVDVGRRRHLGAGVHR